MDERRPDARSRSAAITEPSATWEKRGTATASAGGSPSGAEAPAKDEQADRGRRARTSRRRGGSSRGRSTGPSGVSGRRGRRGRERAARQPAAVSAPSEREQAGDGPLSLFGRDPCQIAIAPATPSSASTISRSSQRATERGRRASAARCPRRPRSNGRRTSPSRCPRRSGHDQRGPDERSQNAIESAPQRRARHASQDRSRDRGTSRRQNRPIAHMKVRNESQRKMRRPGVAALSVSDGMTNCGAGPGFGPTANVNAPSHRVPVGGDRAPEDEVPALRESGFSGVTSVSGFVVERCGRPAVSWCAGGVRDRDGHEPRLDRLVVGHAQLLRRLVQRRRSPAGDVRGQVRVRRTRRQAPPAPRLPAARRERRLSSGASCDLPLALPTRARRRRARAPRSRARAR